MFHSRKWLASCARLPRRDQEKVFTLRLRQPELDRRGVEPRFSGCKPDVVPLDQQPRFLMIQALTRTISERMSLAVTGPPTTASSERLCAFRFSVASCGDQTAESDPCFDATRKCDRISPGFP